MYRFIIKKKFSYLYTYIPMNTAKKTFLTLISSAMLVLLVVFISCKGEVVGPVPEFEFEFGDFAVELDSLDVDALEADDSQITSGSVTNSETETLAGEVGTNAATATNVSGAASSAISSSSQSYWSNQTADNVVENVESGETNTASQVESLLNVVRGNPTLAQYVPAVANPSAGGNNRLAQLNAAAAVAASIDLDDCKQSAQDAYDEAFLELTTAYEGNLAAMETRYNEQVSLINSDPVSFSSPAVDRHRDRVTSFRNTFNTFSSNIASSTILTAEQRNILNILNIGIFAINVQFSLDLLKSELLLALDLKRAELETPFVADFNEKSQELRQKLNRAQNACHNQGSSSSS